jgi:hypothetical protein
VAIGWADLLICVGLAFSVLVFTEITKLITRLIKK